jgi:diguanylate cyclase (GGDEF)-like protein
MNYKENLQLKRKLNDMLEKSDNVKRKNPLYAYELAKEVWIESNAIDDLELKMKSRYRMGREKWRMGSYEEAIYYLNEVLDLIPEDSEIGLRASVPNIMGNIYLDSKRYEIALSYYKKSIDEAKRLGLTRLEAYGLNNIGEIYRELEDHDKALEYYEESIKAYDIAHNKVDRAAAILNMGEVYLNMGNLEKAENYALEAVEFFEKVDDRVGLCEGYYIFARICDELRKDDFAVRYFNKGIKLSTEIIQPTKLIENKIALGEFYLKRGIDDKAKVIFESAYKQSKKLKLMALASKSCSYLANIFEKQNNLEEAINYYKDFHNIDHELLHEQMENRLEFISNQFKLEKSKREKEIYKLKSISLQEKNNAIEKAYDRIHLISQIGKELTSTLDLDKVLESVYRNFNQLMDAYSFGIGIYDSKVKKIVYKLYMEDGKRRNQYSTKPNDDKSLGAYCYNSGLEILIDDVDEEIHDYIAGFEDLPKAKTPMKSVIYEPLFAENNILGVMTIQSPKKNAYDKNHIEIVRALASYVAIALYNSQKSDSLRLEIKNRLRAEKKLKRINKRLKGLTMLDGLTGIANRRRFDEYLGELIESSRERSLQSAVMLIDIDYFKEYNDYYGHLAGDDCLIEVAQILARSIDLKNDLVSRYGGDEFAIVLSNADENYVLEVLEKIYSGLKQVEIEHIKSSKYNTVTLSIGVAIGFSYGDRCDAELFLKIADKALYQAKERGRNQGVIEKINN